MNSILRASRMPEIANIDEPVDTLLGKVDSSDAYKSIINYYKRFTDINPVGYKIIDRDQSVIAKTPTTLQPEIKESKIEFLDIESNHSNYSRSTMERAGIDRDETWNGESCVLIYDKQKFKIGRSDYYTTAPFSRILYGEATSAYLDAGRNASKLKKDYFPLRNKTLSSKEKMRDTPTFNTEASSGGVVIGNKNGNWKMLIARRSDGLNVNPDRLSVIPNGGVEYNDYDGTRTPLSTLKREFSQELFSDEDYGKQVFDGNTRVERTSMGWNLRSGGFSFGHLILVEDDTFAEIAESGYSNFEFTEVKEIDIMNSDEVSKIADYRVFSPSIIPMVMESLIRFDQLDSTPDISYTIQKIHDQ